MGWLCRNFSFRGTRYAPSDASGRGRFRWARVLAAQATASHPTNEDLFVRAPVSRGRFRWASIGGKVKVKVFLFSCEAPRRIYTTVMAFCAYGV